VGPDGSGKSTVSELLALELKERFAGVWRFHWRPGLLPKLSRPKAPPIAHGEELVGPSPLESSKYTGVISLIRFIYYWLDFVFGYWFVIFSRRDRGMLVIGERYYPDVIIHPERYGFSVPRWLLRMAGKCVPSPDLTVLLKNDPHIIYERKPELDTVLISKQLCDYELELPLWGNVAVISTESSPIDVVTRISDLILHQYADRSELTTPNETLSFWRGFPKTGNVKVWVGENDSVQNALNLYHPYSRRGRFLTNVIHSTPESLTRQLFTGIRPAIATEELDALSRIIHSKLGNERLAISFGAGTPGPHHKLTAQVSHAGHVLSYVKVAQSEIVSRLLQSEAEMLSWLHELNFKAAVLPTVLGLEKKHGRTLLYLSAPTHPGKRSPLNVSTMEINFLYALSALNTRVVPVTTALDMLGFTPFLRHLQSIEPNTAGILRDAAEICEKIFEKAGIQVASSHGDYAPWNTLTISGGELYTFDWEYGLKEAPLCIDLFHRVLMPGRLVCEQKPKEIVQKLLNVLTDPLLGPFLVKFRVSREEINGYFLMYLLQLAMRESAEGQVTSPFVLECLRHVLIAAHHPLHRRKILVAAYACEPNSGSEPGVGWNMCQAISKANEAWVVTRKNNRDQIERAMALQPNPYIHFIYADLPQWTSFWKKQGRGIRLYYYLWQFAAWRQARRLARTVGFDLAHHVTFVNDWLFTFLALLPIPFVWGPIGSHPKSPRSLTPSVSALIADRVRYYFQAFMRFIDPLFWLSAVRADLIVGIDQTVGARLPLSLIGKHKFISHSAIGVEGLFERSAEKNSVSKPTRILSMGRLVPIKAFHLTIRAFAASAKIEGSGTLTIVGNGSERASLQSLAKKLGVDDRITFFDWLPRTQALSEMQEADLFLFPSFEGGGMVVLEAMATGLPVVCLDYGGPGAMVTSSCGIKVPVADKATTVANLGAGIFRLISEPATRRRMGESGRKHVQDNFLWARKSALVEALYDLVDRRAA